MKRTAISLMLVLAMVLSVVLVAAPTAEAVATHPHTATTKHCVCGGSLNGVGNHTCQSATEIEAATWIELTSSHSGAALGTADTHTYYYLNGDVTITDRFTITEGATVTICLNGYTLANTASGDAGRVFNVNKKNTVVNLCDCGEGGMVTAVTTKNGAVIRQYQQSTAVFNLFGGTLTGSGQVDTAGAVVRQDKSGTFNMYGGAIIGGKSDMHGANIAVYDKFNMYGGTISGGVAGQKGGNIFVNGTVNIQGGTVTGGTDSVGAGIYVNSGKTLTIGTNANVQSAVYNTDAKTLKLNANLTADMDLSVVVAADTQEVTIDLNGFKLDGTIATGACKLYIADSSATAAGTAGTGSVGAAIADKVSVQETGKRFVLVNGVAHRIYIGVTDVSLVLDGKNVGMGYTTGFQADADVAALIESFGIEVYLKNGTPVVCTKNGSEFVAGTDNKATAHVNNILKDGTDVAHLATEVCAKTFVVIDGEKIYSNEYAFSLQTILQKMDAKADELPDAAADLLAEIEGYYGADFFAAN